MYPWMRTTRPSRTVNTTAVSLSSSTPLPLPPKADVQPLGLSTDDEVPELIGPDDLLLDDDSDELDILSG